MNQKIYYFSFLLPRHAVFAYLPTRIRSRTPSQIHIRSAQSDPNDEKGIKNRSIRLILWDPDRRFRKPRDKHPVRGKKWGKYVRLPQSYRPERYVPRWSQKVGIISHPHLYRRILNARGNPNIIPNIISVQNTRKPVVQFFCPLEKLHSLYSVSIF